MAITIIILAIGSVISGILYHCGGIGKPYSTKLRDIGCSLIILLTLSFLAHKIFPIWVNLVTFGLSWLFLSTYHKYLNKWFNKPRTDAFYFNWLAHGIGIGLAMIPMAWIGITWWLILIRAVVLGLSMMVWSELNDNAVSEEFGRGALIVLSLPLLML